MITWQRGVGAIGLLACGLSLMAPVALAQSYSSVQLKDLKNAPHIFWAKGIIFRDVLEEMPREKVEDLDGRKVCRFLTRELGDVYAETATLPTFATLETGKDYYFAGTVAQKGRRYFYVVNNISAYSNKIESVTSTVSALNRELPTNEYNKVFMVLEGVMQDTHDELFKASTETGIPMAELIGNPEHRTAVAQAVRTSLRRFETISKTTSQEFFVSVIVSMMAAQYGYADTTPAQPFSPEPASPDDAAIGAPASGIREEEWDLSSQGAVQTVLSGDAPSGEEPPDAVEEKPATAPAPEPAPAPVAEPAPEPAAEPAPAPEPVETSAGDEPPDAIIEEPVVPADIVAPVKEVETPVVAEESIVPAEEVEPPDAVVEVVESAEAPASSVTEEPAAPEAVIVPDESPAEPVDATTEPPDAVVETDVAVEESAAAPEPVVEATVEAVAVADEAVATSSESVAPGIEDAVAPVEAADEAPDAVIEDPAPASPASTDKIDYSQPLRLR